MRKMRLTKSKKRFSQASQIIEPLSAMEAYGYASPKSSMNDYARITEYSNEDDAPSPGD